MDMNSIMGILPIVAIIALMWFILIRPQRKREKQVTEMRNALKVGDQITTIGGIIGRITKIKDDTLVVAVGADKVKMEFARWAISKVNESTTTKASRTMPEDDAEEVSTQQKKPRKLGAVAAVASDVEEAVSDAKDDVDDLVDLDDSDVADEEVEDYDSEEILSEYADEEEQEA